MGLRPFACWDCRFESCRGHGCLWLMIVVYCQVEVFATGRSLVQGNPTECGLSFSMCRVAQCGRTDGHDEANSFLFVILRTRLTTHRVLRTVYLCLHVCTVHQQYHSTFLLLQTDAHNYKIIGILKQLKFRLSLPHVSVHAGTIFRELSRA